MRDDRITLFMPAWILVWNPWCYGKMPIPQTTVMGADITYKIKRLEPCLEGVRIDAEIPRNGFLVTHLEHSEEGQHVAERHYLGGHPQGHPVRRVVRPAEVRDKLLIRPARLLVNEVERPREARHVDGRSEV